MKIATTSKEAQPAEMTHFRCAACNEVKPIQRNGGTGYGTDASDNCICYLCCAENDRRFMLDEGRIVLYLVNEKVPNGSQWRVTNWPGTLKFNVLGMREGSHNIAGPNSRTDVWFIGPDKKRWHGVNIGDTQICRCHRLKKQ